MRPHLPVEVLAVAERKLVAGTLFFGIGEQNLEHYEQKWLPELLRRQREAAKLRKAGHDIAVVEDAHWDWAKKMLREHRAPLGFRSCALEVADETEGLMQVELATHRSRANRNLNLAMWITSASLLGIARGRRVRRNSEASVRFCCGKRFARAWTRDFAGVSDSTRCRAQ